MRGGGKQKNCTLLADSDKILRGGGKQKTGHYLQILIKYTGIS
jgi:hypothetical protein